MTTQQQQVKISSQSDLKNFLCSLGLTLRDVGNYWRCPAVFRHGDNPTAISISKKDGSFNDFVTGKRGSLQELAALMNGSADLLDLTDLQISNSKPSIMQEKTWDESLLQNLFPHDVFYNEKGVSSQTLRSFKAGYCHSGPFNQRYVFPIYNSNGKIHGWTGRDMTDRYKSDGIKWKHQGYKKHWVYPAFVPGCQAIQEINRSKEIVLVESIGDMLALWEAGIKNVMVLFGTSISSKQAGFLMGLNLDRIIVATNNDESGVGANSAIKIFLILSQYVNHEKLRLGIPSKKDFGEMSFDEISEWKEKLAFDDGTGYFQLVLDYLLKLKSSGTELSMHEKKIGNLLFVKLEKGIYAARN